MLRLIRQQQSPSLIKSSILEEYITYQEIVEASELLDSHLPPFNVEIEIKKRIVNFTIIFCFSVTFCFLPETKTPLIYKITKFPLQILAFKHSLSVLSYGIFFFSCRFVLGLKAPSSQFFKPKRECHFLDAKFSYFCFKSFSCFPPHSLFGKCNNDYKKK